MNIFYGLDSFKSLKDTFVTMGNFDGVHLAHQKILTDLQKTAQKYHKKSVILTFFPHPRRIIRPDASFALLNTEREKIEKITHFGIDYLINIVFDKKFSRLTADQFIKEVLIKKLNICTFFIGHDHCFGRNKEGNFEFLQKNKHLYSFNFQQISCQKIDGLTVNSSIIRRAILNGEIELAHKFLGYHFQITGQVVRGRGIGKTIDYPTANILVKETDKLIPKIGSYAVKVLYKNKWYKGMLNIGKRPTFQIDNKTTIEVHIFDFNKTIYDENLKILFFKRLRDEQKFKSLKELSSQLTKDKKNISAMQI